MQQLQAIPEIIKQATEILQSFQAPPPMDPSQVAMQIQTAETQRRAQADQVRAQIDQAKIAATTQMKAAEIQSKEQINREDNQTAMLIAASEIEQGHRTNIKNGASLMKGS
jgi:sRNA-binding protein